MSKFEQHLFATKIQLNNVQHFNSIFKKYLERKNPSNMLKNIIFKITHVRCIFYQLL